MTLASVARRFGTPAYVYDLGEIRSACERLRAGLPVGSHVYYSVKANPHATVVAELGRAECGAEISSPGELTVATSAGIPARRCLYTGPAKSERELGDGLDAGVGLFSVESRGELERLAWLCRSSGRTAPAVLRLNPDVCAPSAGLAMCGFASQFGTDLAQILADPESFRAEGVELIGYHVYLGSNVSDAAALAECVRVALDAVATAQDALHLPLRFLDLGGGFGHPFATAGPAVDLTALPLLIEPLLDARLPGWRDGRPTIAFESGRYLVGGCGSLLLRVVDVKFSKGKRFVVVDGGINHLGGMYGLRRVPPLKARPVRDDAQKPHATETVLAGPLCTPLDVLNPKLELADVGPDDLLVIPNVGAYGLTASLVPFLSREAPVEVTVDRGRIVSASRLEAVSSPVEPAVHMPVEDVPVGALWR